MQNVLGKLNIWFTKINKKSKYPSEKCISNMKIKFKKLPFIAVKVLQLCNFVYDLILVKILHNVLKISLLRKQITQSKFNFNNFYHSTEPTD